MVYDVESRLPGDILSPMVNQELNEPQDLDTMTNLHKSDLIHLWEARAEAIERL